MGLDTMSSCFNVIGKLLGDKGTDQLNFNSLKPAGVSLLNFQPEGMSAANSLME